MEDTLIIGAGELGQAIRKVLAEKRLRSALWDRTPGKVPHQKPLSVTAPRAAIILLCVPSWALREVASGIQPYLARGATLVTFAKGLEQTSRKTAGELLAQLLPRQHIAFIGGPMLAEELETKQGGMGILASSDARAEHKVRELFRGTSLRLECMREMRSVALAGVLKNIYAIGLGVATALEWRDNRKGWFAAAAFQEIARILPLLGAPHETAYTPAGLGDFLATGYSGYSSNHHAGLELVATGHSTRRSEGTYSLPTVLKILGKKKKQFAILTAIESVVVRHADAKKTFEKLFKSEC
ncbi:MAG: hypothetical protein HYW65_03665 [Candidatus Liptonbacteria bacterium]|nr:hypothetical protein [Candidatus Liptonbacteria bacterium]MBI3114778.1 hypothetical protein [Candidatus Harrisonbacteria bacterium]